MRFILLLIVIYIASYAVFRTMYADDTAPEGETLVVYPADMGWLATVYTPLVMADEEITGATTVVAGVEEAPAQ